MIDNELADRIPTCPHTTKADINIKLEASIFVIENLLGKHLDFTSGVRCADCNEAAGGSPTSEHLTGHACDIHIRDSQDRISVTRAVLQAGIKRIGIAKTFIHIGVDDEHPQNVLWTY